MKKIKKIGYGALSVLLATGGLTNVAHADVADKKEPATEQENQENKPIDGSKEKQDVKTPFELNDLVKNDKAFLQRAIDLFIEKNKSELKEEDMKKIKEFKTQEDLLRSDEFKDKDINVLDFYKNILKNLKEEIKKNPTLAEQEEFKNFKNLVDTNEIKINVADKTEYEKLHKELSSIQENLYTKDSIEVLNEAIIETADILNEEWSSQESVDAAVKKLTDAKKGLVKKEVTPEKEPEKQTEQETKEVDKSVLINLIKKSKNLIENDKDKYTEESVKKVQGFLVEAQKVVDNKDATQEEVNKTIEDLKKQGLVEKIKNDKPTETVVVDKEKLIKAVKAEKEALDQFTDESKKDMVKALENAQKVIDNKDATKEDVDKAMSEIDKAKQKLVKKIDAKKSEDGKGIMPQTGQDWINLLVGVGILGGGGFGLYKSRKKDDNKDDNKIN